MTRVTVVPLMRVLFVDQSLAGRQPLRQGLIAAGLAVDLAGGAREAVGMAGAGSYDAVVAAIDAPEGGVAVTRYLRANASTMRVPIVLVGPPDRASEKAAFNALFVGASDFLAEPVVVADLVARLGALQPPVPSQAECPEPQPPCFVDVNMAGFVREASPEARAALALKARRRPVHLSTHLETSFNLVPSASWRDLVAPADTGFMRTLFPIANGCGAAYEVEPLDRLDGVRLVLHPVAVSRTHQGAGAVPRAALHRSPLTSASSPAARVSHPSNPVPPPPPFGETHPSLAASVASSSRTTARA
jgi:DNA-binding response OmpR family regulator